MIIKLGTRTSKLALWQTGHIQQLLQTQWPDLVCEKIPFVTEGDKTLDKPLPAIGGKGLFTQELENALLKGRIDMAVHSLKDLPVENPPGEKRSGSVIRFFSARNALLAIRRVAPFSYRYYE